MSVTSNSSKRVGIRYITEDYIRSISKEERLDRIRRLSINGSKIDKPIRYIENMNNLVNLTALDMSNNLIEKIEKIDKMHNLRELNLSNNKLLKLDGLENLLQLRVLNISRNQLNSIPQWLSRRCKYLMNIDISQNAFDSIEELTKLWNLKDLTQLNVKDNPVTQLEHYRLYLIMRLKYLTVFDEIPVESQERQDATSKYENVELDRVSNKLIETEMKLMESQKLKDQLDKEKQEREKIQKKSQQLEKEQANRIQQLQEELKSKENQLKKKSDDLFRACNKYYELEQDLAFIKIDAKFDLLSKDIESLDEPDLSSEPSISGNSGTGDQPYLGKGQFMTHKEIEMLRQRRKAREKKNQSNQRPDSAITVKENFAESLQELIKDRMHQLEEVNKDLEEKNHYLSELNGSISYQEHIDRPRTSVILERPKSALAAVNNKQRTSPLRGILSGSGNNLLVPNRPRKLSFSDGSPVNQLLPDQLQLSEQFVSKFENLNEMQHQAHELRIKMESTEKLAQHQREEVAYLRTEMEKMKDADPNLADSIEYQMRSKEMKMDENIQLYKSLSKRLDQLSVAIEKSMDDIQLLEQCIQQENQYFTEDMRKKIQKALNDIQAVMKSQKLNKQKHLSDSCIQTQSDNIDLYHRKIAEQKQEIDRLRHLLDQEGREQSSARSHIEDNVDQLRKELQQLRADALSAKEDLESEIEMERVLNDELNAELDKATRDNLQLRHQLEELFQQQKELLSNQRSDQQLHQRQSELNTQKLRQSLEKELIDQLTKIDPITLKNPSNQLEETLMQTLNKLSPGHNQNQNHQSHLQQESYPKQSTTDDVNNLLTSLRQNIEQIRQDIHSKIADNNISTGVNQNSAATNTSQNYKIPHVTFETKPITRKLKEADGIYKNELEDIKLKIKKLEKAMEDLRRRKKPSKPIVASKIPIRNYRMADLNSTDDPSYDEQTPRQSTKQKPRSYSQDRLHKSSSSTFNLPRQRKAASMQLNKVTISSSDESALLDAMQDELEMLRTQIHQSQSNNSERIEQAVDSIRQLERQLNDKEHKLQYVDLLDQEREIWSKNLQNTMSEVERCQNDIHRLQEKLFKSSTQTPNYDIHQMQNTLQAQKSEIERLNAILEKMMNINRGSQTFVGSSVPIQTIPSTVYPQSSHNIYGSQTQFLPTNPTNSATQTTLPNLINSQSTPLLNNVQFIPTDAPQADAGRFNGLFCNIPEHHYLEDYVNSKETRRSTQEMKLKQKFKADTEKYLNTLDLLQDDIHTKNEELESMEIQISKQSGESERLHYQIEHLNINRQEMLRELDMLQHEIETVKSEKLESANKSLANLNHKKSNLNDEIIRTEGILCGRREELSRLEANIRNESSNLQQISNQTSETIRKYEETKSNHRQLILECEELEKRSKEASVDLSRALLQLEETRHEISDIDSNKSHLESVLKKIQEVIKQKDREFTSMKEEIKSSSHNLNSVESNLSMQIEQSKEKTKMLTEQEKLIQESRLELNKLKKEIEIKHREIQQLDTEAGQKSTNVQIMEQESDKLKYQLQKLHQDTQSEKNNIKREIEQCKNELEEINEAKEESSRQLESLRMKISQFKDTIDEHDRTLAQQQAEIDKRNWQIRHNDNLIKIKQTQLDKLQKDYVEKLSEVEKSQNECYELQDQDKKLNMDINCKMSEIERLREIITNESENIRRIKFDRVNISNIIESLEKERQMLQNQTKELDDSIAFKKKQENKLLEALNSLEVRLSDSRMDLDKTLSNKQIESAQRDDLKSQLTSMNKQLYEAKCELQSIRDRLTALEVQHDTKTTELRQKQHQYNSISQDITKMQEQLRLMNLSYEEINSTESNRKEKLKTIDEDILRKFNELSEMDKRLAEVKSLISKEDSRLDRLKQDELSELFQLKSELAEKTKQLDSIGPKFQMFKKEAAMKEFAEQKIIELEQVIQDQQDALDRFMHDNRQLASQVAVLTRDMNSQRETHHQVIEQRDKESVRLRKRVAREINQLEKLAEEQCRRANSLADDLGRARRDYLLLKNRILIYGRFLNKELSCLAQEQFIEHQNVFEEYLNPINKPSKYTKKPYSDRHSTKQDSWDSPEVPSANQASPLEIAVLAEHRRHLTTQLNLLRDSIIRAGGSSNDCTLPNEDIVGTNNPGIIPQHSFLQSHDNKVTMAPSSSPNNVLGISADHTATSSGLGSTLDGPGTTNGLTTNPNAASSDHSYPYHDYHNYEHNSTTNHLNQQFSNEIAQIHLDQSKSNELCQQMKSEINNMKKSIGGSNHCSDHSSSD